MDDIFTKIKSAEGYNNDVSSRWYASEIRKLGRINPMNLVKKGDLKSVIFPGFMYLFSYMPRDKSELPYYDLFPLVMPFRRVEDGFYGINFHYMPYKLRILMLKQLNRYASDKKMTEKTRLRFNYETLESARRLRPAKNAVKKYLYSNIRTRLRKIPSSDWIIASQLPVQIFRKMKMEQVWIKERRKMLAWV